MRCGRSRRNGRWDFYRNEWWHYQLFDARRLPLVSDKDLPRPMM